MAVQPMDTSRPTSSQASRPARNAQGASLYEAGATASDGPSTMPARRTTSGAREMFEAHAPPDGDA